MESMQLQCAKSDNIRFLESIDILQRDRSGKRLIDYVLEYKSVKVFSFIIDENPKRFFDNLFDRYTSPARRAEVIDDLVYLTLISNKVQIFEQYPVGGMKLGVGFRSLLPAEEAMCYRPQTHREMSKADKCILKDRCFEAIADTSIVTDETFDYIVSPFKDRVKSIVYAKEFYWIHGLPYVADKCYEAGQSERLEKALRAIENTNEIFKCALNKKEDLMGEKTMVNHEVYVNTSIFAADIYFVGGYSPILKRTFSTALERGDFDAVDRFTSINRAICDCKMPAYIPSEDELRIARAACDDTLTDGEKAVARCIHGDFLNLDELMEVDDEEAVRNALDKYPVDIREMIYDKIETGDWEALGKIAGDIKRKSSPNVRDFRCLFESIAKKDGAGYKAAYRVLAGKIDYDNRWADESFGRSNRFSLPSSGPSFDEDVKKIKASKRKFLEDYLFKRHGTVINYPKELFEDYFERGDYKTAAIFLCTRLEIVLKEKYKLEGDLCAMVDEFAEKQKLSPAKKDLLHTVRMYRNSVVHPTNTEDADKLKNLDVKKTVRSGIDYICSLS